MPRQYPYVMTSNKFREFLNQLKNLGVPNKINTKYLESLGYKSKNDRKFPEVLRFIGLIDDSSAPTEEYRKTLRGGEQGQIEFARLIRKSYSELFDTYPDAHRKDAEALQNFFTAHTDLGGKAIQGMAATFQSLCSFADFRAEAQGYNEENNAEGNNVESTQYPNTAPMQQTAEDSKAPRVSVSGTGQPLTININIQLELPATNDANVYDSLFSSMAKHIMRLSED